jgi:hypothetical protein
MMDGNARTAAPAMLLFVTHPNTMNKVSAIVLKKSSSGSRLEVTRHFLFP